MATRGKKISEQTLTASLDGNEIIPFAKNGADGAVKVSKLLSNTVAPEEGKGLSTNDFTNEYKTKIEQNSDKIVNLESKHAQFALPGFWRPDGTIGNDTNYSRTGLIPINKDHGITVNVAGTKNVAALAMFDAQGVCIWYRNTTDTEAAVKNTITVQAEDIPSNAVYFSASTYNGSLAESSWSNGDTLEARESAVSDAIQRSKKLLFIDQWKSLSKVYRTLTTGYDANTDQFYLHWEYADKVAKKYEPSVTYEQAMAMMANIHGTVLGHSAYYLDAPANLPPIGYQYGSGPYLEIERSEICVHNRSIQVLIFAAQRNGTVTINRNQVRLIALTNLKAVIGEAVTFLGDNPIEFLVSGGLGFPRLEFFRAQIKQSFDVRTSPLLTLDTMQYLVTYAQNTSPITVTVHPDVYAKISGPDDDTQGSVRSYLPLNLADGNISNKSTNVALIDNGVEITRQDIDTHFTIALGRAIPIVKGKKYTLSMDVEGMSEGDNYYLLINELAGGATNAAGVINLYNGRPTAVFTAQKDAKVSELTFDDFDRTGLDKDATSKIKITNIRLSAGEYEALPYVAPPSKIEDEQLREQVYWASLLDEAALKNIAFATTE